MITKKKIILILVSLLLLGAAIVGPIELTVRGYELSIRKSDAEMIEVE